MNIPDALKVLDRQLATEVNKHNFYIAIKRLNLSHDRYKEIIGEVMQKTCTDTEDPWLKESFNSINESQWFYQAFLVYLCFELTRAQASVAIGDFISCVDVAHQYAWASVLDHLEGPLKTEKTVRKNHPNAYKIGSKIALIKEKMKEVGHMAKKDVVDILCEEFNITPTNAQAYYYQHRKLAVHTSSEASSV